jgi:hypothetical protein
VLIGELRLLDAQVDRGSVCRRVGNHLPEK